MLAGRGFGGLMTHAALHHARTALGVLPLLPLWCSAQIRQTTRSVPRLRPRPRGCRFHRENHCFGADGSLRNPHLTEKCIAAPMILSIYVAIADGGLRAFVLGGVHRVDIAATFKRLPEHADELRKLANRQGSLGFCSWEQRLAPRSAVLALTEPVPGISQQRAALLDALQGAQAGAAGAGAVYESQLRNEVRSTTLQSDMREPAAQQAAKSTFTEPGDSKVSSSLCCRSTRPPVLDSSGDTQAHRQERTSKQMAPVQKASTEEGKPSEESSRASLAPTGLQPSSARLHESDNGFHAAEAGQAVSATAQKDAGRSRTGALALQVQQAMKERLEKEEEERRLQREEEQLKANCSAVIASQDSEYQRSLLHDQVRDLQKGARGHRRAHYKIPTETNPENFLVGALVNSDKLT
ncbi:unnamed protein product, partial [Symbiodinium necroappetens]